MLFAGIAVADYPAARAWYERLFGRPADLVPHEREVAWQVADAGWIYVVEDAPRAGRALVTLIVDDLDEHVAGLAQRGLNTAAIEPVGPTGRQAAITDPEGNQISFAEVGGSGSPA